METFQSQAGLLDIVTPVLHEMKGGVLKDALVAAFSAEEETLRDIESAFRRLTERSYPASALRTFFASWSKTNNSAASVSGLANRITLLARSEAGSAASNQLHDVCASLQRITDEDLGALGGVLHADLFYTMATAACGDDTWLLKSACLPSAQAFKDWTDRQRLKERDLLIGLLTTLVHEVYTHGEVEFIHDLYKSWFHTHVGIPADRVRHIVAWVTVHTGGTESNHFGHAVQAVNAFADAMQVTIDESAATTLFQDYLRRKATVMRECAQALV
ncbi:hypothetical protein [Burkholderia cenocepacia]|uniref:hypothetical protein n=1 Tax=Burkholderia cenocepacia TaxID=95486 RepID=UPI0003C44CCE|nr:hypothetical protein [Burkholderia cenocepacia]ESS40833.1 hypothetical protein P355_1791 [Burkholderia cenocepacia KC-01]ELK7723238.1 hypothetical protein [Burkholderia cenocepacia]MCA7966810.1 hypothetical protein [Burkholderia cenocepacia]MDR8055910.1 hypothetical protein [Burkholderia cenocepacia]MDR8066350.1 hypothetical protein [Burkholderia cenocepacia]